MKLPNIDRAIIPKEKLQDYLLSQSHPIGRFKANYFRSLGYASDNWTVFESDVRDQLRNEAQSKEKTEYGEKFEIRGEITGPSGKKAEIITAWIILKGEEIARFITAYPEEK